MNKAQTIIRMGSRGFTLTHTNLTGAILQMDLRKASLAHLGTVAKQICQAHGIKAPQRTQRVAA